MIKLNVHGMALIESIIALSSLLLVGIIGFYIYSHHHIASVIPQSPNSETSGQIRELKNIAYGSLANQNMDVFLPPPAGGLSPIVIFIHGGGFFAGDKAGLDQEAEAVAKVGWTGISINYRLTGYPNESNDVLSAIAWVHAHAATQKSDPKKIALFGTSAGGNLAAEAATIAHQQKLDLGIVAVVSWSGPMDAISFVQTTPATDQIATANRYIGCSPSACPSKWMAASPIDNITSGEPPMLLVNSTDEFVPFSQATSMASKLSAAGNYSKVLPITGSKHATQYSSEAFSPSINWLANYLGSFKGALPAIPNSN